MLVTSTSASKNFHISAIQREASINTTSCVTNYAITFTGLKLSYDYIDISRDIIEIKVMHFAPEASQFDIFL